LLLRRWRLEAHFAEHGFGWRLAREDSPLRRHVLYRVSAKEPAFQAVAPPQLLPGAAWVSHGVGIL